MCISGGQKAAEREEAESQAHFTDAKADAGGGGAKSVSTTFSTRGAGQLFGGVPPRNEYGIIFSHRAHVFAVPTERDNFTLQPS